MKDYTVFENAEEVRDADIRMILQLEKQIIKEVSDQMRVEFDWGDFVHVAEKVLGDDGVGGSKAVVQLKKLLSDVYGI